MRGCGATRASNGASVTPTLQGLAACSSDLILQLDVDLLLPGCPYEPLAGASSTWHRNSDSNPTGLSQHSSSSGNNIGSHSNSSSSTLGQLGEAHPVLCCKGVLQQLADILLADPAAISISLPCLPWPSCPVPLSSSRNASMQSEAVLQQPHGSRTEASDSSGSYSVTASYVNPATCQPWRVEVRGCLLSRSRLMQLLPLPAVVEGKPGMILKQGLPIRECCLHCECTPSPGALQSPSLS